jgi:hypothetical protein
MDIYSVPSIKSWWGVYDCHNIQYFNVILRLFPLQWINCDHENRSQCCFKPNISSHKIVFKARLYLPYHWLGNPQNPSQLLMQGSRLSILLGKHCQTHFFQALITKMINQESQHHVFPCTLLSGTVHFCNLSLSQNQCPAVVLGLVCYSHFNLANVICQDC